MSFIYLILIGNESANIIALFGSCGWGRYLIADGTTKAGMHRVGINPTMTWETEAKHSLGSTIL